MFSLTDPADVCYTYIASCYDLVKADELYRSLGGDTEKSCSVVQVARFSFLRMNINLRVYVLNFVWNFGANLKEKQFSNNSEEVMFF